MAQSQWKDFDSVVRDSVIRTVHARRIAELEREVRELRRANEMLRLHSGWDLAPAPPAVGVAIRWSGTGPRQMPDGSHPMAEFRVLGPLEVTVAGRLAELGAPKQRALLTLLVSRVGQPVTSDVIAEELWTGQPPPSAMTSLQSYVANLRRVLEPDRPPRAPARVLRTCNQGYGLDSRVIAVDARRFEEHATAGWRALDTGDPGQALSEFDAGLALWRGPAYVEAADVTSVMPRAVRLEELRLSVVEGRCAALLGTGVHGVAVAELEEFTLANPLREYSLELLSRALYRAGRQADALSALRNNQGRLTAELGIDPVPALQRLEREILTQDPALDWCPPQPRLSAIPYCRGVNHLTGVTEFRNRYFLMRHGQSKANVAKLIVSSLAIDMNGDYGLTALGREQAEASAAQSGLPESTVIFSSPLARARETAEIVRDHLSAPEITITDALRERDFGDWEGTSTANYEQVWADDQADRTEHGVEPVVSVLDRTTALIVALDAEYDGTTILLAAHGDILQILQAGFLGLHPKDHRGVEHLKTAEIRLVSEANRPQPR